MTIDDELLLELFKPDRYGNLGDNALIVNVVGTRKIDYRIEETVQQYHDYTRPEIERKQPTMTPDMIIFCQQENVTIAIELENDIQWDFQKSLRQLKNYKKIFSDTRIIIPKDYKRFAPLYKHEGFRVFIWEAKRKWQCLRCGTINENESRIPPKCKGISSKGKECKNNSRDEFDLVGLKETKIEEYE